MKGAEAKGRRGAPAPPPAPSLPRTAHGDVQGAPSCKSCIHRRTLYAQFADSGQSVELLICSWLKWGPVEPASFYRHPDRYDIAATCPHFQQGRNPDIVVAEISEAVD